MTPRESDRFEAKAREILDGIISIRTVAAALRAVEAETIERALACVPGKHIEIGDRIRALASPAAAPAAEKWKAMVRCPHGAEGHETCAVCDFDISPSELVAPGLLSRTVPVAALNRILAALQSPERLRANEHVILELRQYIATPAPAQGA